MAPKVSSLLDIAKNYEDLVFKFGRGESLPVGVRSLVWDASNGAYTGYFTTNGDITVVSDSIEDAPDGDGAASVDFTMQDARGHQYRIEDIPLNGTTPVSCQAVVEGRGEVWPGAVIAYTANTKENGSGNLGSEVTGSNLGNIDFYRTGLNFATGGMMRIKPGNGRTLMCIWRCPYPRYGEFRKLNIIPTSGKPCLVSLLARDVYYDEATDSVSFGPWNVQGTADLDNTPVVTELEVVTRFLPPQTDLVLCCNATQSGTNVSSTLHVKLFSLEGDED